MVHVLAIITAHPGQRTQLLEAFHANVANVRAEAGCIEYAAAVDAATSPAKFGDDTFVVIEKWQTPEHLQAHAVAPHMKAYAEKTKSWVKERAIHVLTPV